MTAIVIRRSTTATAAPLPKSWICMDCVNAHKANIWVDCAGPPPVMPYTMSNALKDWINERTITTVVVVRSAGRITYLRT